MNNKDIVITAVNMHFPSLRKVAKDILINFEEDKTRYEYERTLMNLAREDERNKIKNESGGGRTLNFENGECIISPDFIGDEEIRFKIKESKVKLIKPFKAEDLSRCVECGTMKHLSICKKCYDTSKSKPTTKIKRFVGVVGNRKEWSYDFVKTILLELKINKRDTIVSGGAEGVDTHAQRFAKEFGLDIIICYPNPKEGSPKRYFDRNKEIVDYCDVIIAFDKKQLIKSGTRNTINYAIMKHKKVIILGEENEK